MSARVFKVHTDQLGRIIACIRYAMYGVSKKAFAQQMPHELKRIEIEDLVFISEREVHRNILFGPFYVTDRPDGIVAKSQSGMWCEVDTKRSRPEKLPYWAVVEGFSWCLFFDSTPCRSGLDSLAQSMERTRSGPAILGTGAR